MSAKKYIRQTKHYNENMRAQDNKANALQDKRWRCLLHIGPISEYLGDMVHMLNEAVGHGDMEVVQHALEMNWPPCPGVMSAACQSRQFTFVKLFNKAWKDHPGSAIGLHCNDDVLLRKDGDMISFLIKNNMLCEEAADKIGEHIKFSCQKKGGGPY